MKMKRNMRIRKGICTLLAAGVTAGLVSGCSDEKVDYNLDSEQAQTNEGNSLAKFGEVEKWNDEWELDIGDGQKITMVINADISVPDVSSMAVVEVEKLQTDNAVRKQILEAFFGGEEIYYNDAAHQTREELEDNIEEVEDTIERIEENAEELRRFEDLADYVEGLENDLEREKEKLRRCQEALQTAVDTPVPAEEYGSCQEFVAYVDGVRYDIRFPAEEEDAVMYIRPGELHGGAPTYIPEIASELKDYDYINCYSSGEAEADNECPLSREEAREIADQFIESSGLPDLVLSQEENLVWRGWNESDGETMGEDSPEYVYGYRFVYYVGVNGISFVDFGDEWSYMDGAMIQSPDFYSMRSGCCLEVTDDGLIGMELFYPLTVRKVTEQVELLPLDIIQEIMKNEAMEHTDRYSFNEYRYSNAMDLIYFRVKDKEDSDSYSYIPVWRLSQMGSYCYHPILVNAIDGSVIYAEDEL